MAHRLVRQIEAASLRGWPAIEEMSLGSWTLRFSAGFTGRANSVQAPAGGSESLAERVTQCEAWFAERGQPTLFRITPLTEPGLDDFLAERGYERIKQTHVLHRGAGGLPPQREELELRAAELHDWLRAFTSLSGWPAAPDPMARIVGMVGARSLRAVLREPAVPGPAACGLAVLDGRFLGLFDLVVAPDRRRRGLGEELVRRLVSWGRDGGAQHVYLQVTLENTPALDMYAKLGFGRAYDYWYREGPS